MSELPAIDTEYLLDFLVEAIEHTQPDRLHREGYRCSRPGNAGVHIPLEHPNPERGLGDNLGGSSW